MGYPIGPNGITGDLSNVSGGFVMGRAVLVITRQLIEDLLKNGCSAARPVAHELPSDARIVDARYDADERKDWVELVFESASFADGPNIPLLEPIEFRREEPVGRR